MSAPTACPGARRRAAQGVLGVVLSLVLAACGGAPDEQAAQPDTAAAPSAGSPEPTTPPPASTSPGETQRATTEPAPEEASASALPPVRSRPSLATLMREDMTSGRLRKGRQVLADGDYTRREVTYRSGDLTVSGVLLRPRGPGPFPAVVLNHGYVDPSIYVTGQGLRREQDYLARAGFVVLHTDYRGHAGSDPAPARSRETRLGYTRDTINAVQALKREPYVDDDRVAMLGRSMGGGVTLNALVTRPGLVGAAVLFASVSSDFLDNFRRWTVTERPETAAATYRRHGTPRENPAYYRGLSARAHFGRITEPVLMHHGTLDDSTPIAWSRTTQRLLRRAGVDSRLAVYRGEQHAFGPQWPLSMERTVRFLRRELRG